MVVLSSICLLAFVVLSTLFEAEYFSQNPPKIKRIHFWFTALRATVFGLYWLVSGPYIIVAVCSFPLVHDGFYYVFRGRDVYPRGFFDQSTQTDAILSFPFVERVALFTLGLLIFFSLFS